MVRYAFLSLALLSAPAFAGTFQAAPAARPAQAQFVARDNVWHCSDAGCVSTNPSLTRPAIVCAALARQIGTLGSFTTDGRAFSAEELTACNARARPASR
jgi:hypothetical protein